MAEMSGMVEMKTILDQMNCEVWANESQDYINPKDILPLMIQVKDSTYYSIKKQ